MIEDIVALPRLLKQSRNDSTKISSEVIWCLPEPTVPFLYGYSSRDDSAWLPYGVSINLPTGEDTWFRYKIIEVLPTGVFEYFCLADSPIDVRRPGRSRRTMLYCLWVTVKEHRSKMIRKYILWRNILVFTRAEIEDSVVDSPIEAVLANEIRTLSHIHGAPEISEEIKDYPRDPENVLISEMRFVPDEGISQYAQLVSNIREFNSRLSLWGMDSYENDIRDIYRGVNLPKRWSNLEPVRIGSLLPFVQYGPVTIGNILHLIGPYYSAHNFHREFPKGHLGDEFQLDIKPDDSRGLFDILKYVEKLPYSGFDLTVRRDQPACDIAVHDDSSGGIELNLKSGSTTDQQILADTVVMSLRPLLDSGFPNWKQLWMRRSWAEDLTISITTELGTVEWFYFDLAVVAICSRALVRDYQSACFAIGL